MSFYFFLKNRHKRNEISSCTEERYRSRPSEDEKKDEAMNFFNALFRRIFGKSDSESNSLRSYIEKIEIRVLEADSRVESCEHAFYRSVSMFSEYSESSYSECLVYWDRYQDAVREREEALKELSKQMKTFRQVYGRKYKTQVYKKMYTSVYNDLYTIKLF